MEEKSLIYNTSFLGEYECSSLALDRRRKKIEDEIGSLKNKIKQCRDIQRLLWAVLAVPDVHVGRSAYQGAAHRQTLSFLSLCREEVENFTNWKRFMYPIIGIEPQFKNILLNGSYVPMTAGQRKPEGQWTADERKAANLDQRLKSLILSILPDDQMNSVINYSELASLFGKLKYEENLIDSIYESEKKKSFVTATPLSTAFFSTSIVHDFQDSPDDEEDTRSSQKYLYDLEEEYQERALLSKSKRFFKKGSQRFSNAKATDGTTCHKCGRKGLVAKAYEWDEEDVSFDDNEITEVKVLMALADDESVAVGKESARNGEWVKITMKKCISEQIPSQKKRILGLDHLTEDLSIRLTNESSVCSTSLPPLEKLAGTEPVSGPKTIKSILKSNFTFKAETLKGVTINELTLTPATVFTKVAFVNGLKYNLVSISQLCDAKYIVQLDEKRGTIFNSNKNIVMIAPRHKRLAYLNFKTINQLAKQNLIIGLPSLFYSKDKPCSSCEKGKHHRASFKSKQTFSIKKYLHLLHMDLFGPTTPKSINHGKYTLIIVDEYSSVENQNDIKVKQLRSDNGIEFKNSILVNFCNERDNNINILEYERYPPDEYRHLYEPSQRYQVNSNAAPFIDPYERPEPVVIDSNNSSGQNDQHDQTDQSIQNDQTDKRVQNDHPAQDDEILNDDQSEYSNHVGDNHISDNLTIIVYGQNPEPLSSTTEDALVSNTIPILNNPFLSIPSMASPAPQDK
ncbi:retrovirus-related pol polyprotein from transposon TNT 1-94 [Tanacetum coccineum]